LRDTATYGERKFIVIPAKAAVQLHFSIFKLDPGLRRGDDGDLTGQW
jgi:hypothetical protein